MSEPVPLSDALEFAQRIDGNTATYTGRVILALAAECATLARMRCVSCRWRRDEPVVFRYYGVVEGPFCGKIYHGADCTTDDEGNPIVVLCAALGWMCGAWEHE
jgi:hypothetical protein